MTYLLVLAVVVGWLALSVLAVAVWILLRRMTIRRFRAALHGSPGIRRVTRCDVCGQPFDDPLTAVWLPPMIVAHEDCARQLQLSGEPIQAAVDPARPSAGWRRPSGTRSSPTPIRSRVLRRRGRRLPRWVRLVATTYEKEEYPVRTARGGTRIRYVLRR